MKYKFTAREAKKINKHGIDLTIYGQKVPEANVVHVSVKKGHFQEFFDLKSTYTYYIIKGWGTFYLNEKPVEATATDLIVIPPKTRIYYFGTMEIVLTVSRPLMRETNATYVSSIRPKVPIETSRA